MAWAASGQDEHLPYQVDPTGKPSPQKEPNTLCSLDNVARIEMISARPRLGSRLSRKDVELAHPRSFQPVRRLHRLLRLHSIVFKASFSELVRDDTGLQRCLSGCLAPFRPFYSTLEWSCCLSKVLGYSFCLFLLLFEVPRLAFSKLILVSVLFIT